MKRLILIVALSIFSMSAFTQEVITVHGEEYDIMVAEDYSQLKEDYQIIISLC